MAALQKLSGLLPDLSGLIPEPLKPYAKFVVVIALGLIYLLVSLTVVDDATGREWAGAVLFIASALGVAGTTNESVADEDPPPDDALLSDGGDPVDPSGELGFEPDPDAPDDTYQPQAGERPLPDEKLPPEQQPADVPPMEERSPEQAPDQSLPEDESVKGPGEKRRDPEARDPSSPDKPVDIGGEGQGAA